MPFSTECPFCAILVKGVPDDQIDGSVECPRCHNFFAMTEKQTVIKEKPKKPGGPGPSKGPPASPARPGKSKPAAKAVPRDETEEEEDQEEDEEQPRRRREEPEASPAATSKSEQPWPLLLGVVAFLLGSLGFGTAWIPNLEIVAVAFAGLGLVLGGLGVLGGRSMPGALKYPVIGVVVSLPALIWGIMQLSNVARAPAPLTKAEREKKVAVPLASKPHLNPTQVATPAPEGSWVDASIQAVKQGDLLVRVSRATIGKPPVEGTTKKKAPADRCLVVELKLQNAGVTSKIDYNSWGDAGREHSAILQDQKGRDYRLRSFAPDWYVKGRVSDATLFPGKTIDDVLVFEAPPPKLEITYFRLELPAAAYGGTGKLQIQIPNRFISYEQ